MLFYIVLSTFVNVKTKSVCIVAIKFLFNAAEIYFNVFAMYNTFIYILLN